MKKVARSGALSLVRRCSECESLLSRNLNSNSAASSRSLSVSDSVAANDSSSTLISLHASAKHFFRASPPPPPPPPPFSSSSSSFPAAASAVANGSGSVKNLFQGTINSGKLQNSKSVILQRLVGRSLSSSASSESPPPPLPPPPPPYHRENPPDATNPDPVTLQEQWRYATRMYSMWYAHAWGTAILAGLSFYGLGWFIKGENPLQFGSSDKKEEVLLKPE